MKIAVIGAGIFGSVSAIKLKEAGYDVDLFEEKSDILQCASGINQYRLHRGYHYPRSKETALQSRDGEKSFLSEYGDCVSPFWEKHYYCIPRSGSLVDRIKYEEFLQDMDLWYQWSPMVGNFPDRSSKLGRNSYLVQEKSIDIGKFRKKLLTQIRNAGIELYLNTKFIPAFVDDYDVIINCTYANINRILPEECRVVYQFELCEKPVVSLNESFKNTSIVLIDGSFGCIDPYPEMNCHVLGHVDHAIHHRNIGYFPEIPEKYLSCLNSGILSHNHPTNISKFVDFFKGYFTKFEDGFQHFGSMYTIRTVLPGREHDDSRPSYITKHSDNLYSIFSGKIGTCVDIANELVQKIKE